LTAERMEKIQKRIKENKVKILIFLFPIISYLLFLILMKNNEELFMQIIKEDSILEYIQFFLYIFSGIFTIKIVKRLIELKESKFKIIAFSILAILFFFIAFEEISWGQRILNIETPESVASNNIQGELTVHNLAPLQLKMHFAYIAIGIYGISSRFLLKKIFPKQYLKFRIFTPDYFLFFYFLFAIVFWFLISYFPSPLSFMAGEVMPLWKWQELFETYVAMAFLFFVVYAYREDLRSKGAIFTLQAVKRIAVS
jgi:hypothetical protein